MSLYISSLNSGSNANCYYIGNSVEAVLIDAGLKCIEVEKRMKKLSVDIKKVKAIFISHEHTDHINGLSILSKKYQIPIYITTKTLKSCKISLEKNLIYSFESESPIYIGSLRIIPFTKNHDAIDPHSFMVSCNQIHVGVITDIGYACRQVIKYFKQCDAVFLESNYCDQLLENGSYPIALKQRIRSDVGHLSNNQALELFKNFKSKELQLLILSHLSKNNNKPELVEKLFEKHAAYTRIIIASRSHESELFYLEKNPNPIKILKTNTTRQLTLF